eukprot:SAG11_NODE_2695_length_3081_cov_1.330315_3_plen_67_part_00
MRVLYTVVPVLNLDLARFTKFSTTTWGYGRTGVLHGCYYPKCKIYPPYDPTATVAFFSGVINDNTY